jgi:glycosyltransferase involved in cell wall biosynthesis
MPSTLMLLSNPHRPDPRVLLEARALGSAGYGVHLLAWDREASRAPEDDEDGIHVIRLGPKCPSRSAVRILTRLPRFWVRALRASKGLGFDVVHAHDFDTLPLGMAISKLSGKPLLYDAHELYAKMIENEVGPLSRIIWMLERRCARRAEAVITVSTALASELSVGRKERATVVATSQDPSVIDGADVSSVRGKYGLKGFVVSYLGSLEPGRFVEEFITSFKPEDRITLLIGGSGTLEPLVAREARGNQALKFIGTVGADDALKLTWASDLVLAMMDPSNPNNVIGTPGKIINALAVGRPMVTTKGLNIAKKVEDAGCGITIPYSKSAFVEAVLKAAADPRTLTSMGRKGRELYDKEYSWTRSKNELLKVYEALIRSS